MNTLFLFSEDMVCPYYVYGISGKVFNWVDNYLLNSMSFMTVCNLKIYQMWCASGIYYVCSIVYQIDEGHI